MKKSLRKKGRIISDPAAFLSPSAARELTPTIRRLSRQRWGTAPGMGSKGPHA